MNGILSEIAADNVTYWPKVQYEKFLIAVIIQMICHKRKKSIFGSTMTGENMITRNLLKRQAAVALIALSACAAVFSAQAEDKKPNIIIIWGDDIGQSNVSAYTKGLMGYRTPNIDRVANEGVIFTDYYAEQSCTAGRSAFITGQSVFRTGLSKVGLPGSDLGLRKEDVTIAQLLKGQGYATGQFGKNHLGDKDEFLPTAHGFDEFYGNLYH